MGKVGKAFYDLNEQQLEYKDSNWRVKANFGDTKLFNLKMKLGTKTKGKTRNNIQFGTDQSHFGSDKKENKLSVGGMFTFGVAGILATTRLKVFQPEGSPALETFTTASLAGIKIGCDMRVTQTGDYCCFLGASYGLPSIISGLSNVHVGSIVSLPAMRPSVGMFAEASVPLAQKAVFGVELFEAPRAVLFGAQVAVDDEHSVVAKAGNDGIAQLSFIKKFKGLDLRMGAEANLSEGSVGKLGVKLTLK